ncbi:hypothetical protein Aperf_G00000009794 [Anoplocephala perfoliata]
MTSVPDDEAKQTSSDGEFERKDDMSLVGIVPQEQPAGLNPETLSTSGTTKPMGSPSLQFETVWDPEWDCMPIFVPPVVDEAQIIVRLEAARRSKRSANDLAGVNTGTSPTLAAQIPLDQQNFDDQSQRGGILHSDAKHPTSDNYRPSYLRRENAIPTITHHDDGKQPFEIKGEEPVIKCMELLRGGG